MTWLFGTWFMGTKLGRWLAALAAGIVAVALIAWRIFAAGKAAEAAKQNTATIRNYQNRAEVEDAVSKQNPDARRAKLSEWVSDDE